MNFLILFLGIVFTRLSFIKFIPLVLRNPLTIVLWHEMARNRAVATIGAWGGQGPPPPPNIWEIKILSYFYDDSVETPKFKTLFCKISGASPPNPV